MKKQVAVWMILGIGLPAVQGSAVLADPILKEAKPVLSEFHSEVPAFPLSFEYPKEWGLEEEKGTVEKYHSVRLLGPRNPADTYTSTISVTGIPLKSKGGKFESLSDIVNNYKEHQLRGARFDEEKVTVVGGQGAVDLTVTSVIPPLLHKGLKPAKISVRTRALFTQKGSTLYRITYSADVRIYGRHLKKFNRLLETLQFE